MYRYQVQLTLAGPTLVTLWVECPSSEFLAEYLKDRYETYVRHVILDRVQSYQSIPDYQLKGYDA